MKYNLVFAGGGAKGIVHVGALKELELQGHEFNRLVGTSAGAITATLLAAGYSADEVQDAITEKLADNRIILASFMDIPDSFDDDVITRSLTTALANDLIPNFLPGSTSQHLTESTTATLLKNSTYRALFSLVELGGLYSGDRFLDWMREKLDADGHGLGDATMAQFHEQTGSDLTCVATDTVDGAPLNLNHRTAPDLPVIWAVRMSMGIPLVFQEVLWRAEWGTYRGRNIIGHSVVDGGLYSTLPLELLLSHEAAVLDVMGGVPSPSSVIGLYIDATLPVPGAENAPPQKQSIEQRLKSDSPWSRIIWRVSDLVNTMTKSHDNLMMHTHPKTVCRLPAKDYDTLEFDMSDERLQLLVHAGQAAMHQYLAERASAKPEDETEKPDDETDDGANE
jgi:predicted acylesterase/phospholipase RssA